MEEDVMCPGLTRAALAAAILCSVPSLGAAQPSVPAAVKPTATPISDGLRRAIPSVAAQEAVPPDERTPKRRRSFVKRRPVWAGLLIGAAAGTALAANKWGSEGAFVGFYGGAAAGAATGWLLSQ